MYELDVRARGGPETAPLYTPDEVAGWGEKLADVRYLSSHDHAGTIMTRTGAAIAAELIRMALAAGTSTEAT